MLRARSQSQSPPIPKDVLKSTLHKLVAEIEASIDAGDVTELSVRVGTEENKTPDGWRRFAPTLERFLTVRYVVR